MDKKIKLEIQLFLEWNKNPKHRKND
jgi:hypothetical protein